MSYCTKCGVELSEGMDFCTSCGTKIGTHPPSTPVVARQDDERIKDGIAYATRNEIYAFVFIVIGIIMAIVGGVVGSITRTNSQLWGLVTETEKPYHTLGLGLLIIGIIFGVIGIIASFYYDGQRKQLVERLNKN